MKINLHDIISIMYAQGYIWWSASALLVVVILVAIFGMRGVAMAIPRVLVAMYSKTQESLRDVFSREDEVIEDEDEENPFRGE